MVRLIGAGLVWGGCTVWGLRAAVNMRRQVGLLEEMSRALEYFERELTLNRTALPELIERLSNRETQNGSEIFRACGAGIKEGGSFSAAWEGAVARSGLNREEQILLNCLSGILGRYDAQEQARALSHLRQEVEERCSRRREQARDMGRVYGVLGITAGGLLTMSLL